jgi:hypothetical protein
MQIVNTYNGTYIHPKKADAYSVLIKNVNDDAELAGIGAIVYDGNAADLDKTLVHLW